MSSDVTIISLGGSMIFPTDKPDVEFLKRFREIISRHVEEGKRFLIITGGGKVCRKYQETISELINATDEDKDWIGIQATQMNGHFIRYVFKGLSAPRLYLDPADIAVWPEGFPIVIGAGWKPGCSSDHDAVLMAEALGSKKIINLSNVDYAYDKDPKKFPEAKRLDRVTWTEYRSYIPDKWTPGMSAPFDPTASKHAQELGIEVAIIGGSNFASLENCLDGREFEGSHIVG